MQNKRCGWGEETVFLSPPLHRRCRNTARIGTTVTERIVAIRRAGRYSPNSIEKDAAILEDVSRILASRGLIVVTESEEECSKGHRAYHNIYISMGRNPKTLEFLKERERHGAVVVNSSESVSLCCRRGKLNDTLRRHGIPTPGGGMGEKGCWLKRGDGVAETEGDIRFVSSVPEMEKTAELMKAGGATCIVAQEHVEGDLVKFYGVRGEDFFKTYYPGDDGLTKFGDERRNGKPQHYAYDAGSLRHTAEKAATATGLDVYGGDCIIRPDGSFCIIDLNDWPSFSRCRAEAAEAIARLVERKRRNTARERLAVAAETLGCGNKNA